MPNIFKSGDDYADHDNQPAFLDDFPEENVLSMGKKKQFLAFSVKKMFQNLRKLSPIK